MGVGDLTDGGIILIDKPAGMTSFGVVARVRRVLIEKGAMIEKGVLIEKSVVKNTKTGMENNRGGTGVRKKVKVGHTGTLDPFATGLMILLVGKMTKRSGEFLKLDKEYEATIRLGAVSTTGDIEGEIKEIDARKEPSLAEVEAVCRSLIGKIQQRVPRFSAVKIGGRRAYELTRKGIEVEMPEREVKIYRLEILDYQWPILKIRALVSSGTYLRALGEEIGRRLKTGGYLTELRRTEVGKYRVEMALTLEEWMNREGMAE